MALPVIRFDPRSVLCFRTNIVRPLQPEPTGTLHLFDWQEVLGAAAEADTSIDRLLCHAVVRGFGNRRRKRQLAVWLSPAAIWTGAPAVGLFVSGPGAVPDLPYLRRLPWHAEAGRDRMPPAASVWMWWNGEAWHRLYARCAEGELDGWYVADLGGGFGPVVGPDSEAVWRHLAAHPGERPDLSPVPRTCEEVIDPDTPGMVLRHVWWERA